MLITNGGVGDWVIANFDISNLYGPQQDWEHGLGGPIDGTAREYLHVPASAVVKIPKTTKLSWGQLAVSNLRCSLPATSHPDEDDPIVLIWDSHWFAPAQLHGTLFTGTSL